MNIQSVVSAYGAKPYEPSAKSGKKAAPENTTAVLEKEQVEFSDTSLNLQKMRNLIDDIPDVRIAKVERSVEDQVQRIPHGNQPVQSC